LDNFKFSHDAGFVKQVGSQKMGIDHSKKCDQVSLRYTDFGFLTLLFRLFIKK